jgi:hypothetical protein
VLRRHVSACAFGTDPGMDTVLCSADDPQKWNSQAYAGNTDFDVDEKGCITRGDLSAAIDRAQKTYKARWAEVVQRLGKAS